MIHQPGPPPTSEATAASEALQAAVENMVLHCAEVPRDARLLILREPVGLGYYADDLAAAVADAARALGHEVTLEEIGFDPFAQSLPAALAARMSGFDLAVFLARLGDQLRFFEMPPGTTALVTYALDVESFASAFGTAPHRAFQGIKAALDAALQGAEVTIGCAAGTEIAGRCDEAAGPGADTRVRRFPLLVSRPVAADAFSGRVALCGFLAGTGSRYYEPFGLAFEGPVFARFAHGRLTGFDGAPGDVDRAERHYDTVSARFAIERNVVHSWHAGIHPACAFVGAAGDSFERWSGSAFGNPRLLHFHTCGAYAPGEICWNVVDPTIAVDGVAVWESGRFHPERIPGGAEVLQRFPAVAELFARPRHEIGL